MHLISGSQLLQIGGDQQVFDYDGEWTSGERDGKEASLLVNAKASLANKHNILVGLFICYLCYAASASATAALHKNTSKA